MTEKTLYKFVYKNVGDHLCPDPRSHIYHESTELYNSIEEAKVEFEFFQAKMLGRFEDRVKEWQNVGVDYKAYSFSKQIFYEYELIGYNPVTVLCD